MDNKQFELIQNFIDQEFEERNVYSLKNLRRILNEKIQRLEDYDYFGEAEFTLLQTYEDFYKENFTRDEKMQHQLKLLGAIFADINFTRIRKLRIYQTIGIEDARILSHPGCGKATLDIYEQKLNKHGLSIHDYISPQRYKELTLKAPEDGPKTAICI